MANGTVSQTCVKTADGVVELRELPIPEPRPHEALLRMRLATICGSDIHIVHDFPMPRGVEALPMGHEMVGEVVAVGADVRRFSEGQRVIPSCIYGCGACSNCLRGRTQLCLTYGKVTGITNALAGGQGEYLVVPHADVNMTHVPDAVDDQDAILATDIMSTGFGAVEAGGVATGDTVAVFAQGPVGLCATAGARTLGASLIIAVESVPERQQMARRLGANVVLTPEEAADGIRDLTGGKGVDVAVEALGRQETFAAALAATRLDGTVSSVGVYATERSLPVAIDSSFYSRRIVTSLCPSGSDRLDRLLKLLEHGRTGVGELITHTMKLSEIVSAYDVFANRRDGAIKIALVPDA
jgi:threonine dehydrogenase-like Zn-dependent dehydrogenase